MTKYIYDFSEGSREMRDLLGGKGANVAEMTRILGADRVPGGFTITTGACMAYLNGGRVEPDELGPQVQRALDQLEQESGKRLGNERDPLLVSVRSGARESMPGMLDTILNLGLNDRSVAGLAEKTGNERFAWDSYRRFVQMFGNVSRGIPGDLYERAIRDQKASAGVSEDSELSTGDLRQLTGRFKELFLDETGLDFPAEPEEQLGQAVRAVFESWSGRRAVEYRRINRIPDDWGTAVNVQRMVFGNMGENSGSGVAFSRNEITGAPEPSGDFLPDAQGEDIVSGVRNPRDLSEMGDLMPEAHKELIGILRHLEKHFGDMQDTEFTVEDGRLYMLQTRSAKRPSQAAVRFAADAVSEGLLSREQALMTIDAAGLEALLHPTFDPESDFEILARGVNASPGAAKGELVFTAEEAVAAADEGRDVILARAFTEADDVAGFFAAKGILTSEGGKASHAALVARGMGRPCVAGASAVEVDATRRELRVGDVVLGPGDSIAIDGTSGVVTTGDVPLVEPDPDPNFQKVLEWADEFRRLGVRTNADTPLDAVKANEFGAEGIGLCRTEHMFMAADRQPRMRAMIMAAGEDERRRALDELLPLQQGDFEELFEVMRGKPVTIRLLDPPLHEFLPDREEVTIELARQRAEGGDEIEMLEQTLEMISELTEVNPMIGTRGVRLGILHTGIYEMQAKAIVRAAMEVRRRTGEAPRLEIMIPLVAYEKELEIARELILTICHEEGENCPNLPVGTMIELPRACLVTDRISEYADFFSFGTNDLTQTAIGFSRDDIEGRILARYIERGILDRSPFETLDIPGVGQLIKMAARAGRQAKPGLGLGVCGEHGGDPDSINFFEEAGLDYVSCSPYRVPIARVAAAQASIASRDSTSGD